MLQIKIKTSLKISLSILTLLLLGFIFLPNNSRAVEYKMEDLNNVETWQINQDINDKRSEIQLY